MGIKYVCDNCRVESERGGLYRFKQRFDVFKQTSEDEPEFITGFGYMPNMEPISQHQQHHLCQPCIEIVIEKYREVYIKFAVAAQEALLSRRRND